MQHFAEKNCCLDLVNEAISDNPTEACARILSGSGIGSDYITMGISIRNVRPIPLRALLQR